MSPVFLAKESFRLGTHWQPDADTGEGFMEGLCYGLIKLSYAMIGSSGKSTTVRLLPYAGALSPIGTVSEGSERSTPSNPGLNHDTFLWDGEEC